MRLFVERAVSALEDIPNGDFCRAPKMGRLRDLSWTGRRRRSRRTIARAGGAGKQFPGDPVATVAFRTALMNWGHGVGMYGPGRCSSLAFARVTRRFGHRSSWGESIGAQRSPAGGRGSVANVAVEYEPEVIRVVTKVEPCNACRTTGGAPGCWQRR